MIALYVGSPLGSCNRYALHCTCGKPRHKVVKKEVQKSQSRNFASIALICVSNYNGFKCFFFFFLPVKEDTKIAENSSGLKRQWTR